jgi:hypothetical protein
MKYRDPENIGLLNYLNLHHDLEAMKLKNRPKSTVQKMVKITDNMPTAVSFETNILTCKKYNRAYTFCSSG